MSPLPSGAAVELADAAATERLGAEIATQLEAGDVLLLAGSLGAGKTTLTRGLVAALGGDGGEVCSPTFVLLESYGVNAGGIRRVHHADLYRLHSAGGAAFSELGLGEVLDDPEGVTVVEWPEGLTGARLGAGRVVRVYLETSGAGRRATIRA